MATPTLSWEITAYGSAKLTWAVEDYDRRTRFFLDSLRAHQ